MTEMVEKVAQLIRGHRLAGGKTLNDLLGWHLYSENIADGKADVVRISDAEFGRLAAQVCAALSDGKKEG